VAACLCTKHATGRFIPRVDAPLDEGRRREGLHSYYFSSLRPTASSWPWWKPRGSSLI